MSAGTSEKISEELSTESTKAVSESYIQNDTDKIQSELCEEKTSQEADDATTYHKNTREPCPPGMSKKQWRKLKKKERWLVHKTEKRQLEKQKKKKRKQLAKEQGEVSGPSKKALKRNTMKTSSCKVKVVLDCSFDDKMGERDIMKLTQQIQYSYSSNRRADDPMQFYVTSLDGKCKERLDSIGDFKGWDVYFHEKPYEEVFDKAECIYLSSDSPNMLHTLEPSKAYIIGGLVDHNQHKGLCHRLAEEKGIAHAQLPIGEFMELKSRKVLAINHVFDILLRFTETESWEDAFYSVIPKRKVMTEDELREHQIKKKKSHFPNKKDNLTETKVVDNNVLSDKECQEEKEYKEVSKHAADEVVEDTEQEASDKDLDKEKELTQSTRDVEDYKQIQNAMDKENNKEEDSVTIPETDKDSSAHAPSSS